VKYRLVARLYDNADPRSAVSRMRARRLRFFSALLGRLNRPARILDVGGTEAFWNAVMSLMDEAEVTILNRDPSAAGTRLSFVQGDAGDLSIFEAGSFDVVFSNSTIEHLGSLHLQAQMAREVLRVGRHHFVQTPARAFPIDPHFLYPYFNEYPARVKQWLFVHASLTWHVGTDEAKEVLSLTRLLKRAELQSLFPRSRIDTERFLGIPKSYTAYGGPMWDVKG
jgi:2-polyprenyl-3-methyl-5-hydroxy-6-metoxy-1,4-benzoquinol methylase